MEPELGGQGEVAAILCRVSARLLWLAGGAAAVWLWLERCGSVGTHVYGMKQPVGEVLAGL